MNASKKLLSLTYKVLTITQPPYLHHLISVQCPRSTRSSSVVTIVRPHSPFSLKITDRSFRCASLCLLNLHHLSLRQPHSDTSSSISNSPIPSPITSSSSISPLCISITHSLFQSLAPGSKHTDFTNSTRYTPVSYGLPSLTFASTVSYEVNGFCL